MKVRAITALFFVIVLLASMLLSRYLFAAFFALLSVYCLNEFYRIISDKLSTANRLLGSITAVISFALYAGFRLEALPASYLWLTVPLVSAIFIAELYQTRHEKPFAAIAYTLLGIIYVVLPFTAFFTLGFMGGTYDYRLPLGFMLVLWANDTGAYLVGRYLGRRRLFERISPNKTWEGFAGGVLLALFISWILAQNIQVLLAWQWISVALLVSVFGTFGDLVESMLKRSQQVKDSGDLLPGHGGLLDRFDGLLLAAPVVLAFLASTL